MSDKIKMRDGDTMLIMVKGAEVIHFTPNMSLPHSEFVKRTTGQLPAGAWVGTVSKLDGEVAAISSKHFFGYQLPAPTEVTEAVRRKFEVISPRMPTRRAVLAACLVWLAASAAERDVPVGGGQGLRIKSDPGRVARLRAAKMPEITRPVLFNTPEADGILSALEVFPPDNAFNQVIDDWPVHPNSQKIVASIGREKPFRYNPDMGFVLVPANQPRVEVKLVEYSGESDRGSFPVPDNIPIEGWPLAGARENGKAPSLAEVQRRPEKYEGDRHAIVVDPVNRMLYEFFTFGKTDAGWAAGQASVFDLKTNRLRPEGWTSADAAGLPIFPAVVRYDEIQRGLVEHAMRVTVRRTRRAYVHPATHYASRLNDENLPRMGERLRLRSDFDVSGFSASVQAILKGLKKYGMFVADNGIDWAISVAPDARIPMMHEELRKVKGADFEVVVAPE